MKEKHTNYTQVWYRYNIHFLSPGVLAIAPLFSLWLSFSMYVLFWCIDWVQYQRLCGLWHIIHLLQWSFFLFPIKPYFVSNSKSTPSSFPFNCAAYFLVLLLFFFPIISMCCVSQNTFQSSANGKIIDYVGCILTQPQQKGDSKISTSKYQV